MNKLDTQISRHSKDIIQKYTSALFKDVTLEFYGIKTARIKELVNVELPVIEVKDSRTDFIFLLEDNTYLHFEFQTTYNKDDIVRFADYDLRLYKRDKRNISTVVIYSADVKEADTMLNIGSVRYAADKVMMGNYDGNAVYSELRAKIDRAEELQDIDMLNLIFLPLMKNTAPREELAVNSIELAQTIQDKSKRDVCIASVFAFAHSYLNENNINNLLGVIRMTDIATILVTDKAIEIAKKLLKRGLSIETVVEDTGLDETTVKDLQLELKQA